MARAGLGLGEAECKVEPRPQASAFDEKFSFGASPFAQSRQMYVVGRKKLQPKI